MTTAERLQRQRDATRRELQIEKALDRIRQRALAMERPGDIAGVVEATRDAFEGLGIEPAFTRITIRDRRGSGATSWIAWPDESAGGPVRLDLAVARERGALYHFPDLSRKRWCVARVNKTQHRAEWRKSRHVFDPPFSAAHAEALLDRHPNPNVRHTFAFGGGFLGIDLGYELGPDELRLGRRIAQAFGTAWKRLQELLDRDARNRELEVQNALERVRGAAMEMRSADEIRNVVGVVRRELIGLGFSDRFPIIINYVDEQDEEHTYAYFANRNPRLEGHTWSSPDLWEIDEQTVAGVVRWHESEVARAQIESSEVMRLQDDIDETRFEVMLQRIGLESGPFRYADLGTHITGIPFTHGQIAVRADDYLTDVQIDVVRQLCDGLSFGFTRFQDFQQLEADAERARIERGAERIRAEAQAMQSTHDLHRVAGVVQRQLLELGFEENGVTLIFHHGEDDADRIHTYAAFTNPRLRGRTWSSQILVELDERIVAFRHIYDIRGGSDRIAEVLREGVAFSGDISPQHMREVFSPIGYDDLEAEVRWSVEHQSHYTGVRFANGNLAWRGTRHLDEREVGILEAFGDALSLGLVRFRDFQRLEQASVNKSQFLRRMSHDLRSPMNAILGYTRLLRRRLADRVDEREARNLANIETSSTNLLNLVNDILDLSRIEAGRIEVSLQPVVLRRLADECADALASIVKPGVVLRRELQDVGEIETDPDRLRQVVMNLLGNATKFTETGSITLSLRRVARDWPGADGGSVTAVSAPDTGADAIELAVADTGIGIPLEDLPHIFDEFRQVERQGGEQSEGTGLGLAIARKTVELLGGEIAATSQVGRGTTFIVRLGAE